MFELVIHRRAVRFSIALLTVLLSAPSSAYDRDRWENFTSMNYVTSIAESPTVIFVGTTGGIRRYDRFAKTWQKRWLR